MNLQALLTFVFIRLHAEGDIPGRFRQRLVAPSKKIARAW
jgi:hypothetical protein